MEEFITPAFGTRTGVFAYDWNGVLVKFKNNGLSLFNLLPLISIFSNDSLNKITSSKSYFCFLVLLRDPASG